MSETMGKLVYFNEPGDIELREYEVPSPEPNAVMTQIERANICGTELHIASGRHPEVPGDMVLGHEAVCRIAELGENVETDYAGKSVEEGDLVVPVYFRTCQHCNACQRGAFNNCENAYAGWARSPDEFPHFHGTFGTHYYIHPDQYFYRVPDSLSLHVAAAANCATSQLLFGLENIGVDYGDTVVIQGAGGLGLNAIAIASEWGAETIVIEGVENRISKAHEFHADHVVDMREYDTVEKRADRVRELTGGEGADVGVEVAGVPEAFAEGVELIRDGGRYLEMGNIAPGNTTEYDPAKLTRKSITVVGLKRYNPWYLKKTLEFLDDNADKYPFESLLDAEFDLTDVHEAFDQVADRDVTRASLLPSE